MATILLSAAGAAIGSGFGGTVLGLSGAVIGRAVGATLGRVLDQKLLGAGSEAVEVGRVDRFRLMGASEGAAVAQVFGRVRVAGQVIWATRFMEQTSTTGGGKGAPSPRTTTYSYSVSLAVALCQGRISSIGRIWADGVEIASGELSLRVYTGSDTQLPDPKIEAVEGADLAPAYRGIAYVVIEDLELGRFGNRVPQLSFEVIRPAQGAAAAAMTSLQDAVRAVALIPGTGEYSLATTAVHYAEGDAAVRSANVNSPSGRSDFLTSLKQLEEEAPNCGSVSLVVSWFGSDLRCGTCEIRPKVEQTAQEGVGMVWRAGGIGRDAAQEVPRIDWSSVYGGTPADAAVVEAITALRAKGQSVMFYPFILMEQLAGNGLENPWDGAADQPPLPWRGRITLAQAPGRAGSSDQTSGAVAEVADFFGSAQPSDFTIDGTSVSYAGATEWRYRRFILHYAHLCAAAGGVDAFCIGSEMRGLTQIRGPGHSFPAVAALRQLAAEVRAILGAGTKISYAADWSEYFGYHTGGNVYFHLDPLWADPNIDFIGIDNYMPLSDWRDEEGHLDAAWRRVYDLDYLKANVAGGEGFDWYYDSDEAEQLQRRRPIEDGAYGEPWVYRYKDLRSWWSERHHDRIDGVRAAVASDWVPQSKPVWFTEYGCAAIDKGANQPNRFLDPKSSESVLPRASTGRRDDLMQMHYLLAFHEYWADPVHNPRSALYDGRMLDTARSHVWAWDARPYPAFPAVASVWSDGGNYARGHWITGRMAGQRLAAVVAEICERAGLTDFDVSDLVGVVRGFYLTEIGSARAALQPLMLAYGFDATDQGGKLVFRMRDGKTGASFATESLAVSPDLSGPVETSRSPEPESAGRVQVGFTEADGDFAVRQAGAVAPGDVVPTVAQSDLPLVLTRAEGAAIAERWLAEAQVARDTLRFALPRSAMGLRAGDVARVAGADYRIDRLEHGDVLMAEGVRTERGLYLPAPYAEEIPEPRAYLAPLPIYPVFLDLPLLTGSEVPGAPHVAAGGRPWPGTVALWSAPEDAGYALNTTISRSATIGRTETVLARAPAGRWDRGAGLRVRLTSGHLTSAGKRAVLGGGNAMAIGDADSGIWEVFQFTEAQLVAPMTYELRMRLRGQAGTDGVMPDEWPIGSQIVLLDGAPTQIDLPPGLRGLERHYRIGVAARGYDHPTVTHRVAAFEGVGLRPYAPCHLTAQRNGGDLALAWVRRTRSDGDGWQAAEVPLGEDREDYLVQVWQGATLLREDRCSAPGWTYPVAMQSADGAAGPVELRVAQLSASFGAGPTAALTFVL
ncbi:host specificity protein [Gemmobacter lutimaris]|uniref:Host specificity protein n=1 Tax=Gemmobacter lutimaris TaxID=2306023 RepID=A0A398BSM2_9RHOB|nr:glycoside hydrolase TIM-barrel-like domain-containing protein [Gemmobacter lutimaris]RID91408.1 host specificity protein [Gemmobacter lutimaris]